MKKRIVGALLIILVCIPFIYLKGYYFSGFVSILSILALKEIKDLDKSIPKIMYFLSIIFLVLFNVLNYFDYRWLILLIITMLIPTIIYKNYKTKTAFYLIGNVIFLSIFFSSLIYIRNTNANILLYLLLVAVLTDVFAYIVGKSIGKHKYSTISPNKTIEGNVGGTIIGVVIATIFYYNKIGSINIFLLLFLTFLLSFIGQVGDLVFSKIKRENNIKDFSNLIPGHGGILDRIDSFIFILLTYLLVSGIY